MLGTLRTLALAAIPVAAMLLAAAPARAAEPLVDAAWLKARLGHSNLVVLDVTSNPRAYAEGHIPGAVFTHYAKDGWRVDGKRNGRKVAGMLPPVDRLEALIGGLGIGNDDHVVLVANGFSASEMGVATRIYWTFKVLGHDAVSILDGGMAAWRADEKNPLEKSANRPAPKDFAADFRPGLLADAEDVRSAMEGGTTLIDARPPDQYLGLNKSGAVRAYGTIPGAFNVPAIYATVDGGGTFRDAGDMATIYGISEAPTEGEAVTFCNTGHWASVAWFVNSEILGNKRTRMYDGSMADWTTDDSAPVDRKVKLD